MTFHIDKDESIHEVQEKFSSLYPFLRINFFKNRGDNKEISGRSVMFCPEVKMEQANPNFREGKLEITDKMTVTELENKLYDRLGLSAQISRKSGNLWLETSMTSNWTLSGQNEHGREISPKQESSNNKPQYFAQVPYGC